MKTYHLILKQISFFLVIGCIFSSCQSPKPIHHEPSRQNHAKEILNREYEKTSASRFESDPEFSSYIEEYLNHHSRDLSSKELIQTLIEESAKNQYDPVFLIAIIKTESQFNPRAVGSAGEIGLMQIKPDTAKWICEKKGIKWKGKNSLKDPHYNIQVGALYFKYLKKSLQSKAAKYITAYNRGIGGLNRMPTSNYKTNSYFNKVLKNYLSIYRDLEMIRKNRKV